MQQLEVPMDAVVLNSVICTCASAGKWEAAMDECAGMRELGLEPSVGTLGAVIVSCARDGDPDARNHAWKQFMHLKRMQVPVDAATRSSLATVFGGSSVEDHLGPLPDPVHKPRRSKPEAEIQARSSLPPWAEHMQAGDWSKAQYALQDALLGGQQPELRALQLVVKLAADAGQCQWAVGQVLPMLHELQIATAEIPYNDLVTRCAEAEDWPLVLEVYEHMLHRGANVAPPTYRRVLEANCRGELWEGAINVFEEMMERKVVMDSAALDWAVHAIVRAPDAAARGTEVVLQLGKRGLLRELPASAGVALLDLCASSPNQARKMYDMMQAGGMALCPEHHGAVLGALARAGRWLQVTSLLQSTADVEPGMLRRLLEELRDDSAGVRGEPGSPRVGRWAAAELGLQRLERCGEVPNDREYCTALRCAAEDGEVEAGLGLLQALRHAPGGADTESCNALLSAGQEGGQWKQVLEVYMAMQEARVKPNTHTYCTVITAWQEAGQWEAALQLFGEMRANAITADFPTFRALILACAGGGQWQRMVAVFKLLHKEALVQGWHLDQTIYQPLLSTLWGAHQRRLTLSLLRHALSEGVFAQPQLPTDHTLEEGTQLLDISSLPRGLAEARVILWLGEMKRMLRASLDTAVDVGKVIIILPMDAAPPEVGSTSLQSNKNVVKKHRDRRGANRWKGMVEMMESKKADGGLQKPQSMEDDPPSVLAMLRRLQSPFEATPEAAPSRWNDNEVRCLTATKAEVCAWLMENDEHTGLL
ncbi:hypothetical protein CYMTET_50971 [Cymbomonas tetramitiformis]|uniref:Pentatricopeptide repeat-containing protein, chloroplastic n=1 Tax=Cymbomonas tetramitiformis TaxID=36881 RepID=A0AAE0BNL3_9CHLO|nr:hypothetical protein CYMTET_50971 [Cymbomonas tetramitiformis]